MGKEEDRLARMNKALADLKAKRLAREAAAAKTREAQRDRKRRG